MPDPSNRELAVTVLLTERELAAILGFIGPMNTRLLDDMPIATEVLKRLAAEAKNVFEKGG